MAGGRSYRPPTAFRRLLWRVRDLVFLLSDTLMPKPVSRGDGVLIIAAHGMGDLLLLLAAYRTIARHYKAAGKHVTLVCTEAALDLARRFCTADEVVAIDRTRMRRDLAYRLGVLRRVAGRGYAAAIQTSYNRDLLVEDSIVRASRAPERLGSAGTAMFIDPWSRRIGDRWYTRLLPARDEPMHELARNAELLHGLGIEPDGPMLAYLDPPPRLGVVPRVPYVLFAVGSSHSMKSWPLRGFEAVARALADQGNVAIAFSAGAEDGISRADFARWDETRFIDRLGTTSLDELLSLIAHAALVVSTDSAPVHLAAALDRPALAVTGGGMVARYHPYPELGSGRETPGHVGLAARWPCFDCGWRCIYPVPAGAAAPCVAQVTEHQVLDAVRARLQAVRDDNTLS